jgi:hypothetical protein
MATEKQVAALEKWLSSVLEENEKISSEIPFDDASLALEMLIEASKDYKNGKAQRGHVTEVKRQVVEELRKNGYIEDGEELKDGGQDDPDENLEVGDEYEDLEGLEPEEEKEVEDVPEDLVREYVKLYADIWEEVLRNKTFAGIEAREQGIAVAGVFREIIKTKRTERIAELRREENEEEGE